MAGETLVGVVGSGADSVADAVAATAVDVTVAPAAELGAVDLVVASGSTAVSAAATDGPDAPVLPVDAGRGVRSVPAAAVGEAVASFAAGEAETTTRPVLSVSVDGDAPVRALFDVMLVTTEPARISEYAVTTGETPAAEFRADGVVVATPAGSTGYADAADGPVLDPETDVLSVTPVAPFVTDAQRWVVPDDDLTLSVERDEGDVSLLVDGRDRGTVSPATPVRVRRSDELRLAVVDESRPFY